MQSSQITTRFNGSTYIPVNIPGRFKYNNTRGMGAKYIRIINNKVLINQTIESWSRLREMRTIVKGC